MRRVIIIAAALTLAACGDQGAIEKVVKEQLVDPDSAKFENLMISENHQMACVDVNAKNKMGGYTGFTGMFVGKKDGKWAYAFPTAFDMRCDKQLLEPLSKK